MCSYYLIYIQNTIGEKYKISFIKDKIMYTILPSQSRSQQGLKFAFVFFFVWDTGVWVVWESYIIWLCLLCKIKGGRISCDFCENAKYILIMALIAETTK